MDIYIPVRLKFCHKSQVQFAATRVFKLLLERSHNRQKKTRKEMIAFSNVFALGILTLGFILCGDVLAGDQESECFSGWKLVYHHNENGKSLVGNKFALMGAVLAGSRVRVAIGADYFTEAQGLYVRGNEVHAELLNHISKSSWNQMQKNAYWWWVIVSTSGKYYMTRYYVGGKFLSSSNIKSSVKWYAKPACYKPPIYSNDKVGKPLVGTLSNLVSAVKKGHELRCVTSKKYAFALNNIAAGKNFVAGQNVDHVSKGNSGSQLIFQNNAYWWFTTLSTKGTRDMSRWSIGSHVDRGHTSNRVEQEWFDDGCWTRIFAHSASGTSTVGSRAALIAAIQSGRRIRFQIPSWNHYTAEADNLSIRNGHVTAQALKHVSKASLEKFQDNVYWDWLMVSTTGTVRQTRYNVGANVSRGNSASKLEVHWFVETRPWTLALSANQNGSPISGSKSSLINAIRQGASVRCVQNDGLYAFPADNLAIHEREVAAQTLHSVSMQPVANNPYEITITAKPYWWFTIVDTTGRREMSRWSVGQHTSRGHNSDNVAIKWFVNK